MPLSKSERNNLNAGWVVRVGSRNLTVTRVDRTGTGALKAVYASGERIEPSAIGRVISK